MPLETDMSGLFEALFGDGSGLVQEDGKWTFVPVPGLPKLPNEGLLTYLNRLAANCIIMRGVWQAGTYQPNQCVAHNGQLWITLSTTTATPGTGPWTPLFYSLTGLKGDPGREGYSPIVEAP